MVMPILARNDWTVERLATLPDDGNRYEIIDGELFVTPTPSMVHQMVCTDFIRLLDAYVSALGQELFGSPIGVPFSERTYIEPDVSVGPSLTLVTFMATDWLAVFTPAEYSSVGTAKCLRSTMLTRRG